MHKRRFDAGSLIAGLFFLGLSGVFLTSGLSRREVLPAEALIPTVLIGLGLVGLALVVSRR